MKVLHLWDNYAPGLFDHTHAICLESGLNSRVLCLNFIERNAPTPPRIEAIRRLPLGHSDRASVPERLFKRARFEIDLLKFRARVLHVVRDEAPDVIHIHYGTTAAMLVGLDALFTRPCIVSFYGFDISQALQSRHVAAAYRRLMSRQPLVHVLCDAARNRVLALGCQSERIVDQNLPVDVERYVDLPFKAMAPLRRWLIPARFVKKKGHAVALDAFEHLLKACPDARLTCWGYGDSSWVHNLVAVKGLQHRVAVVDNKDEPDFNLAYQRVLQEHDAVLAPSVASAEGDDEGGPALTAVMAQAAGKPIVCSDFPGSERSVTDGVEGYVVAQNDAEALAAKMLLLANDPALARSMGEAGRQRVIDGFSRAAFRATILQWYGEKGV